MEYRNLMPPIFIHTIELLLLQGQFLLDIITTEDGFKVHPCALAFNTSLNGILYEYNLVFQLVGLTQAPPNVWRCLHHHENI